MTAGQVMMHCQQKDTSLHQSIGKEGSPSQEAEQDAEMESEASRSGNKSEDESSAEAVSPDQQSQSASPRQTRTPEKLAPGTGIQSPHAPPPLSHMSPSPTLQPPPSPHSLAMQFSPPPSSQPSMAPSHGSPSVLVQQQPPLPLVASHGGPASVLSSLQPPPAVPSLMASPHPQAASLLTSPPAPLDADRLMQEKVRQQQLLLQQQKTTQEQEELFRLQQQALMEKQKEENEKQAQLLRLQQEALKQNEDEQKQLQALGLKPLTAAATISVEDTSAPAVGSSGCTSSVAGVGALLAALQRHAPPSVLQQSQPSAALAPPPGLMGAPPSPLLSRPSAPSSMMAGRPQGQVGLMGHSPLPRPPKPPLPRVSPVAGRGHGVRTTPEGPRHQRQQGRDDRPPPLMSLQVSAPPAEEPKEVRLPQALEEALAYKHQRAKQVARLAEIILCQMRMGLL